MLTLPEHPKIPGLPLLGDLTFHHILSVPKRKDDEQHRELVRTHLLASLVGAHIARSSVAILWMRSQARAPLRIYLGGPPRFGEREEDDGEVALLFPPGSR